MKKLHNKKSYAGHLFFITILNEQSLQNRIEFALRMTVDTASNTRCSAVGILHRNTAPYCNWGPIIK